MFRNCSKLKTIYASVDSETNTEKPNFASVGTSTNMFTNCSALVGAAGTAYETDFDSTYVDKTYACIAKDGTPGYFTDVSTKTTG